MQDWKRRRIIKVWRDWCDRTTFHGFNELQYLTGRVYKGIFWSCLIAAATAATAYGIVEILRGYASKPTAMSLEKDQLSSMALPDLMVCSGAILNASLLRADGASEDLINGLIVAMQGDPALLVTRFQEPSVRRSSVDRWEIEMRDFEKRNNISSINELAIRYHVQCRAFVLGCAVFSEEDAHDCCGGAELILDPEYFGCYRLSGFGQQTWLGDRAGVSVIFKTSLEDDNPYANSTGSATPTLTQLKDGVAIQPVPIMYPHDLYKIRIPGDSIADVSLQWHETNLIHSQQQPCYRLKANLPLAEQAAHTEAACYNVLWGKAFASECGCNAFSLPHRQGIKDCGAFDFLSCFILNRTSHDRIMTEAIRAQRSCLPVCQQIQLTPIIGHMRLKRDILDILGHRGPEYENTSLSVVSVYYRSLTRTKNTEIFLYPPETFISNIGGQIGLWMGCSILTVVQALAYLLKCCQIAVSKRESWTESKSVADTVRRKFSSVDASPDPDQTSQGSKDLSDPVFSVTL